MARVRPTVPEEDGDRLLSLEELEAFFRECNAKAGPGREPDWDEHLAAMRESRLWGITEA